MSSSSNAKILVTNLLLNYSIDVFIQKLCLYIMNLLMRELIVLEISCILLPLSVLKVKLSTIKLFFMVPKVSLPVGLVHVACFFFPYITIFCYCSVCTMNFFSFCLCFVRADLLTSFHSHLLFC
jgi:hypothetical protein